MEKKNRVFEKVIQILKANEATVISSTGNNDQPLTELTVENNYRGVSHYPAMFAHLNRNVISVTCNGGNYGANYTSIGVYDTRVDFTSFGAALITNLLLKKLNKIKDLRANEYLGDGDFRSLRSIFYEEDDIILKAPQDTTYASRTYQGKQVKINAISESMNQTLNKTSQWPDSGGISMPIL